MLFENIKSLQPIPLAARSKVYMGGCLPAEIVGSNPTVVMDVCLMCVLRVVK